MLSVRIDIPDLDGVKKSVRFAVAKALTLTARDASTAIKEAMPRTFMLRRSWVMKGIRFDRATPDSLESRIYSIDPYMAKQEDGEKYQASGHVAIPLDVRRSPRDNIPRGMLPRATIGRKDIFKGEINGLEGIYQRMKGGHIKILYLLKSSKTTKPRWGFGDQVSQTVENSFDRNFEV